MEIRKNESIFRVGTWHLAYWRVPGLLKELKGTATVEQIAELARKKYPYNDFTKSIQPVLTRLSKGSLVNKKPIVRQNYDKSWTLLEESSIDGRCHTCKNDLVEGHLCHRLTRQTGTTHRHVMCAKAVGVLHLSKTDYKIWAAGLKREHEFYDEMMALKARLAQTERPFAAAAIDLGTGQMGVVNVKPA